MIQENVGPEILNLNLETHSILSMVDMLINTINLSIFILHHSNVCLENYCFGVQKAQRFKITVFASSVLPYTVKKVIDFPIPSRDITNQTLPGRK